MPERRFLVFEVPAQQTRVGAITQRRPGCHADMVGRPLIRDEGHAYLLHFIVRGIDQDTRAAVLGEMEAVYHEVETLDWDPERGVWELRGVMPIEQIQGSGLRFVAGLFGLASAPWVIFKDGTATVRLLAREPQLMPNLAEAVDARLQVLGIDSRPRFEEHDLANYRLRARSLGSEVTT